MPRHTHGGKRVAGPGKQLGRPTGSTLPPESKVESKQTRVSVDALAKAAILAEASGLSVRQVIERLLLNAGPEDLK